MLNPFESLIKAFTPNNPRYVRCEFEIYRCRRDKHYLVEAHVVAWSPIIWAHTSKGTKEPIQLSDGSYLRPIFWLTTDGRLVTQSERIAPDGKHLMIFVDRPDRITMRDQEMLKLGLQGNFDKIDRILQDDSRNHLLFVVEMLVRKAREYPQTIPAALETQFDKILEMQPQSSQYELAKLELLDTLVT